MRVITYPVNCVKRDMPVKHWLVQPVELHRKIAGLLDYGYDRKQITQMIGIPMQELKTLMRHYGYKTIDKLPVRYKDV